MREAEYIRLLEAVDAAMKLAPACDPVVDDEELMAVPLAANDNCDSWPHFPFPEGWTASC